MGGRSRGGAELLRSAGVLLVLLAVGAFSGVAHAGSSTPSSVQVYITASPGNLTAGGTVGFNSTVSGVVSLAYVHYNWTFGDGSYLGGLGPTNAAPLHTYSSPGNFVASVNASEGGSSSVASITVSVQEASLTVTATASVLRGAAPLTVVFRGSVSGGSGTYVSEFWSFGDGHNGSGLDAVPNTYTTPGTYTAELTVTDSEGASQSASVQITVVAASPPPPNPWYEVLATWVPGILWAVAALLVVFAFYRSRTSIARRRREEDSLERSAHGAEPPAPPSSAPELNVPATPPPWVSETSTPPPSPTIARAAPPSGPEPSPVVPSPAPEPAAVPAKAPQPEVLTDASIPSVPVTAPPRPPEEEPAPRKEPARSRPVVPPDTLRLSLRLVVHIATQGTLGPHDVAPASLTQAGMAEAFGTKQNTIATILKRLEVGGMVVSDVRHVRGGARRMKVYRLTTRGEALAREVRSRPSRKNPGD